MYDVVLRFCSTKNNKTYIFTLRNVQCDIKHNLSETTDMILCFKSYCKRVSLNVTFVCVERKTKLVTLTYMFYAEKILAPDYSQQICGFALKCVCEKA